MRCVINTLFRWNPMKLVTYYLEGVIKETKQFCVLEKVFSCDLQARNQQAAFWENSGFSLSVKIGFFRDRGSIVKSFGNWNYLTNLWDMCWYCFPRPPRGLTCVWIPAKSRLTLTFFKSRSDVQTVMFWLLLIRVVDLIGLEERLDGQLWVLSSPSGQTSPVCSLTIPRTIPLNQTDQNSNSSNLLLCCQCPSAVS